jgi:cation diffusion facilitator family transporter
MSAYLMSAPTSVDKSVNAENWRHSHNFSEGNPLAERNTRWAVLLTFIMMVAEITGGWIYNSMALLADGWHMSSHALALGLSVAAYTAARRLALSDRFAFGTWKIEILGGYTSAIFLVAVAILMLVQSTERLLSPSVIHYNEAIIIAMVGLSVNLICAWLLKDGHRHNHNHGHDNHSQQNHHNHDLSPIHNESYRSHNADSGRAGHQDLNLRAAYLHVVTDAATSVLAIIALFGGKLWGADWLDPVMGIVGATLVAMWAYGLVRDTGRILLDAEMDKPLVAEIHNAINSSAWEGEITDLHVWRIAQNKYACIIAIATQTQITPSDIKRELSIHEELVHISVEINHEKQI